MKGKGKDYFSALYDLARVVNSSLETEDVLERIVHSITRAMDVKAASIRLLDAKEKRLLLGAAYGLSEDYLHKGPIVVEESGLDKQALSGKTVYLKNAQTDRNFHYGEKARAEGIKSVLVAPLIVEEKAIGVLRVYADRVRSFSDREMDFLEAAANLSAIAIKNARLHLVLKTRCDLMAEHKYRIDDH